MEPKNKIKRRNFFYYIGAAVLGTAAVTKFPIARLFKKTEQVLSGTTSIKITENPNAIKRTGKGPVNG